MIDGVKYTAIALCWVGMLASMASPTRRAGSHYCGADLLTGELPDEQKILCNILYNYSPLLRPVRNWTTSVRVGLSLSINQIFELDERNQVLITNAWIDQEWVDEFLMWDPKTFGIKVIRIPARYLWLPDIMLYNNGADYVNRKVQTRAMVKYDGTVFYPTPVKLYSSYFPFDMQTCWMKFGSWTHDTSLIDIYGRLEDIDLSRFVHNGEWEIVNISYNRHLVRYSCCVELYSDLTFYIRLKRKRLYYLMNIFFPSFTTASLTMLTFLMPPESGEKLTLGVTVLLSFSVFMLSVTEKLPETSGKLIGFFSNIPFFNLICSEYIPLISIYLCIVLTMLSLSITATIVSLNIHSRKPDLNEDCVARRRPPRMARRFAMAVNHVHDISECLREESMAVRKAIEHAEEVMKLHYLSKTRRAAVAFEKGFEQLTEGSSLARNLRRASTMSDLLRKQNLFSMIRQLIEENQEAVSTISSVDQEEEEEEEEVIEDSLEKGDEKVEKEEDDAKSAASSKVEMIDKELETDVSKLRMDIVRIINRLVAKAAFDAQVERSRMEWKLLSAAIDRVLFCIFVFITTATIVILLVVVPAVHGYYIESGQYEIRSGAVEYPDVNSTEYTWNFYGKADHLGISEHLELQEHENAGDEHGGTTSTEKNEYRATVFEPLT